VVILSKPGRWVGGGFDVDDIISRMPAIDLISACLSIERLRLEA
jgi:hypothetical protein